MFPFAPSIAALSLAQALSVALPGRVPAPLFPALRSRWWALALPAPIAIVVAAIAVDSATAHVLTYLALVAVPPLAAIALALLIHGARPPLALLVPPLFAAAWALQGLLPGEAAAVALSALACVSLGWLLVGAVPARWVRLGIYAMAALDAWLVASDLLQGPNAVLNSVAPGGGLPRLQYASFGSAVLGFGDLFVAATLGALLAGDRRQAPAALLAAAACLSFDLLFFAVDELPATVPIALTLLALQLARRRHPAALERSHIAPTGGKG